MPAKSFSFGLLLFAGMTLSAVVPEPLDSRGTKDIIQARQLTRAKLNNLEERSKLVKDGVLRPRSSGRTYPTCPEESTAGYAMFPGFGYIGAFINGSITTPPNSQVCLDYCFLDPNCMAAVWIPDNEFGCKKESEDVTNESLVPSPFPGASAFLKGSCADLEQYFDASKMQHCCDTVNKYPICTVTEKYDLPGYARFANWRYDSTRLDVTGNPFVVPDEVYCQRECNRFADCASSFFWGVGFGSVPLCDLFGDAFDNDKYENTSPAAQGLLAGTDVKHATCNIMEAAGLTADRLAACCNTNPGWIM